MLTQFRTTMSLMRPVEVMYDKDTLQPEIYRFLKA